MATIFYTSSYGSDDPTRATLAFVGALGAVEAGHTPQIALIGEAVYLMKDYIAAEIDGVGWPPLEELMSKMVDEGVEFFI